MQWHDRANVVQKTPDHHRETSAAVKRQAFVNSNMARRFI